MIYFLIWLPFIFYIIFLIKAYCFQGKRNKTKISMLEEKHKAWIKNKKKL